MQFGKRVETWWVPCAFCELSKDCFHKLKGSLMQNAHFLPGMLVGAEATRKPSIVFWHSINRVLCKWRYSHALNKWAVGRKLEETFATPYKEFWCFREGTVLGCIQSVYFWEVSADHSALCVPNLTGSILLQVLTLASNERIPLNPTMRLLFEISHLRTATPATVSRAGRWQGRGRGWHFILAWWKVNGG